MVRFITILLCFNLCVVDAFAKEYSSERKLHISYANDISKPTALKPTPHFLWVQKQKPVKLTPYTGNVKIQGFPMMRNYTVYINIFDYAPKGSTIVLVRPDHHKDKEECRVYLHVAVGKNARESFFAAIENEIYHVALLSALYRFHKMDICEIYTDESFHVEYLGKKWSFSEVSEAITETSQMQEANIRNGWARSMLVKRMNGTEDEYTLIRHIARLSNGDPRKYILHIKDLVQALKKALNVKGS